MDDRIALLRSYAALVAVLEEHARTLSLAIVDLQAQGDDARANVLAELERGHHTRINKLRSEADALMGDDEPPDSGV